ncbi:MAG: amidohydrolase family protein [Chloroflexi bacterium]|nr:amidohydrolase family protein [Chloroflexota bacterium]
MIVDSHAHVDEVPALGWMDPAASLIALMDQADIDQAIVMTYTELPAVNPNALEYLADQIARYSDRLIGYVRLHPWYPEVLDLLERAFGEFKMKGVKLHPVGNLSHPSSDVSLRVIRRAAAHHAPVLFHCGDEALTTPLQIALAAEAVPDATIILGHMGGYFHVDEAIEVAARLPNLYLETSAMPYPAQIRRAIDVLGAERILFASDGPGCSPKLEVHKVRLAGVSSSEADRVFSANILELLDRVEASA